MLITFQSVIPIFMIIVAGFALRQAPIFTSEFWTGLERLGFFVLYPTLLFVMILNADFSGLALGKIIVSLAMAWTLLCLLTLALWPILKRYAVSAPTFSSIFQSSVRWNGFIALVIAEKMFPPEGAAVVALVMAVIVIPINVATVTVVASFTDSSANIGSVLKRVAVNPLIIGAALGLLFRLIPGGLPIPIMDALQLISRAALGMGLLAIGAGLRANDVLKPSIAVYVPTILKLAVLPVLVLASALLLGIRGPELSYLALCSAVPTAMNGYVLARQMGGDAEAYAATATLQTIIAFFSIPAVLAITGQLTGG